MEENKFNFPTETIELPSKGLIYPETNPLSSGKIEMKYQGFNDLQLNVIRWAEQRRIIPNSTPQAQFLKAVSEMGELADGIAKNDRDLVEDSVGDALVCIINM